MNAPDIPCPHCGALNNLTAKKCRSCQRSLQQESPQRAREERGGLRRLLGGIARRR